MVFTVAASPILHLQGVSFATISIGFGILYSILAAAQIPTGAWADIFGAKKSSIIGGMLQFSSMALFSFGPSSNFIILSAFALYGLGASFVGGALSSLLFATAKNEGGANFNSNKYFSLTEKVAVASYVIASASVGFLSDVFERQSFAVAGLFFLFASLFVAYLVNELPPERTQSSLRQEFFTRISLGFKGIKDSSILKVLLPVRMLHQVETILGVLWLPWIQLLGGGEAKWFSILATGSYVIRYIVNHYFSGRPRPHHYVPRVAVSLALMALGCLFCVYAPTVWVGLFGVWIMAGARGAFLPAVQAIQHEEFQENVRSTGLSVMNFTTETMIAVSYFVSAPIIDKLSVQTAWGISAGSFLISAMLCLGVLKSLKQSNQVNVEAAAKAQ